MILHKTNWFVQKILYPNLTWKVNTNDKIIYLTFDDGPIPCVTNFVLNILKDFNAKATFFCVGENIKKHPRIFEKVINSTNSVGNHTFNHLIGWKTEDQKYFQNLMDCQDEMMKYNINQNVFLFRPPHGRIKRSQLKEIQKEYRIIMWTVLSGDYDISLSKETCLSKSIKYTNQGTIIVFHDSVKASKNMEYTLPRYLKYFSDKGFKFEKL